MVGGCTGRTVPKPGRLPARRPAEREPGTRTCVQRSTGTRVSRTPNSLENEQAATAVAFLNRAREWFAKHGIMKIERIITDNGACYRSSAFATALRGTTGERGCIRPSTTTKSGAATGPRRKSSFTPESGPQNSSARERWRVGTCTTTTTGRMERTTADRPRSGHHHAQRRPGLLQLRILSVPWTVVSNIRCRSFVKILTWRS